MPRKPKPLTDAQRVKTQAARAAIQHAVARSRNREAEVRRIVQAELFEDNMAAWKAAWEVLNSGASPTLAADICGVSRATMHNYAKRYEESLGARQIEVVAEAERQPWTIDYARGEEWILNHPDLGEYRGLFEPDGSLTVWKANGVYKPTSREHQELRDGGEWTDEHELMYAPLRELFEKWTAAGAPNEWSVDHAW